MMVQLKQSEEGAHGVKWRLSINENNCINLIYWELESFHTEKGVVVEMTDYIKDWLNRKIS